MPHTLYVVAAVVLGLGRGSEASSILTLLGEASGNELLREVRGIGLGGELKPLSPPLASCCCGDSLELLAVDTSSLLPVESSAGDS